MNYSELDGIIRDTKDKFMVAYSKGYKAGINDNGILGEKIKEAYQNGLNDAWEFAKQIHDCQIPYEAFGLDKNGNGISYASPLNWGENLSAEEALDRYKKWKEKQEADGNTWMDIPVEEMSESQLRCAVNELRKMIAEGLNE